MQLLLFLARVILVLFTLSHPYLSYSATVEVKAEIIQPTCNYQISSSGGSSLSFGDFTYVKNDNTSYKITPLNEDSKKVMSVTLTSDLACNALINAIIDKIQHVDKDTLTDDCIDCVFAIDNPNSTKYRPSYNYYYGGKNEVITLNKQGASLALKSKNSGDAKTYYFPLALYYDSDMEHIDAHEDANKKQPNVFCVNEVVRSAYFKKTSGLAISSLATAFRGQGYNTYDANYDFNDKKLILRKTEAYCVSGRASVDEDLYTSVGAKSELGTIVTTLTFYVPISIPTSFWTSPPPVGTEFFGTIMITSTYL